MYQLLAPSKPQRLATMLLESEQVACFNNKVLIHSLTWRPDCLPGPFILLRVLLGTGFTLRTVGGETLIWNLPSLKLVTLYPYFLQVHYKASGYKS